MWCHVGLSTIRCTEWCSVHAGAAFNPILVWCDGDWGVVLQRRSKYQLVMSVVHWSLVRIVSYNL